MIAIRSRTEAVKHFSRFQVSQYASEPRLTTLVGRIVVMSPWVAVLTKALASKRGLFLVHHDDRS